MTSRIDRRAPVATPKASGPSARSGVTPNEPQQARGTGWVSGARPGAKPPVLAKGTTLVQTTLVDKGPAKFPTSIAGVPVQSARNVELQGLKHSKPLMHAALEVKFGKLNESQFNALKAEFGGQTKVPFDANREYHAIDFLPPALQGLVNKDVDVPPAVELKGTAKFRELSEGDFSVSFSPNCHGTAWEAMRAYQGQSEANHAIYYGDAFVLDQHYADEAKFSRLGEGTPGQPPAFLKTLKPGDVVTFHEKLEGIEGDGQLLHSATYAGGGMFFEKPDTESEEYSETPYRLVTYEQAVAPIKDFLGGTEPASVARRPKGQVESALTIFGSGDEAKLTQWAKKQGTTLGRPLLQEIEVGMGGAVRGIHASAMDPKRVRIGNDGRGVLD